MNKRNLKEESLKKSSSYLVDETGEKHNCFECPTATYRKDGCRKTVTIYRRNEIATWEKHQILFITQTETEVKMWLPGRMLWKSYESEEAFNRSIDRIQKEIDKSEKSIIY